MIFELAIQGLSGFNYHCSCRGFLYRILTMKESVMTFYLGFTVAIIKDHHVVD